MAKSTNVPLTHDEWIEVYYALESKVMAIKAGHMGPEEKRGDNKAWIEALEDIKTKISDRVSV